MALEYSVELCRKLEEKFRQAGVYRPLRVSRYDAGAELEYDVTDITSENKARVRLLIERFVGGGFAGQVYKVRLIDIDSESGTIGGLEQGKSYAMKILVPPTGSAKLFRNILYRIGFQGPFQLQVNLQAATAGALWQKFIRRAGQIRFGEETVVNDIHAVFVDHSIGSCGELSDWVDGRTWRLEVDERMDLLKRWNRGRAVDQQQLGSAEYRAKKQFMSDFVKLLHEMGAYEFARQYEWSTCKSQPNCLKRMGMDDELEGGLVAVDFRAGLALLPCFPMSPGDIKLIFKGIARGSLVQFDRGSVKKLEKFVDSHRENFSEMQPMLERLKEAELVYRNSVPDITHNHVKLLYSKRLWSTMFSSAVTGWRVRNLIDEQGEEKFRGCKIGTLLFCFLGAIPILGRVLRKFWARADWRKHYISILGSCEYFKKAMRARITEKVINWYRAGRVNDGNALKIADSVVSFSCHLPLSILPAGLHRFLTDRQFRREKLVYIFVRPVRLYFNAERREQWLREMLTEGRNKHMLSDEDSEIILSTISEPFIQKYLKSLAVHICTLPVTQVVSVAVAIWYKVANNLTWGQAWDEMLLILAAFQIVPISPGSLVRGFYVLYLVIKEKNFKDYNIAVFLGFFKYIGYLAFPIQMTQHYPALARFMAGHWATEAVHIIPVFGERGALLEHWVFCLFYNRPLTIRRRMHKRGELRSDMKARYWHIALCAIIGAGVFGVGEWIYLQKFGYLPNLREIWWLVLGLSLICGAMVTLGAGGMSLGKRFACAALCGFGTGLLYIIFTVILLVSEIVAVDNIVSMVLWRVFVLSIFTTIGAIITEIMLPGPDES
ncbi:MAG: hypothetical protein ACYTBV_13085 [Planctomycetota bacterium]|jgi:hypothetical protein